MDRYVGRFAHLFHVRPWEIEQLEYRHYQILKAEADQWLAAQQKARQQAQQRERGVRGGH